MVWSEAPRGKREVVVAQEMHPHSQWPGRMADPLGEGGASGGRGVTRSDHVRPQTKRLASS